MRRIARKRGAMRTVMAFERLWPLLVPIVCVPALFVSLAWLGIFNAVPMWFRIVLLVVLAGFLVFALAGLRRFRMPDAAAVDRRIEAVNGVSHQALSVQDDALENDSGFSRALWTEHRRRMAARIADLRTGPPEPDTPQRDPYGLRVFVVLLLVTAFAYSHSSRSGFMSDAFTLGPRTAPVPVRLDAWVTPPSYTGRAPIFLSQLSEKPGAPVAVGVPEGSVVTVRISGGGKDGTVTYDAGAGKVQAIAPGTSEAKPDASSGENTAAAAKSDGALSYAFKVARSGTLSVAAAGTDRKWSFDVIGDKPPTIAFSGEPTQAVNGALELSYTIEDDYGVEKARAEIVPVAAAAKGAHPLYGPPDFPLSVPNGGRSGKARSSRDLTDSPLAGKQVKVTLVATDAAGHEGRSATKTITLPEHPFDKPLARAVAEERQTFALDTNQMPRALELADALTVIPEEIRNPTHYLLLRSARSRMALAKTDDQMRDTADYLWQIALGIDNGDLSLAQQRLRDAQRALSEALKNHASDKEISRLMEELRQAMNDLLKEMAKTMPQNQKGDTNPNGKEQVLRQQDLERMLDQIENLARSGQRDQAEQLLSQLQQMMNNLQAGRQQEGQQGDNSPMRQQMDKLGSLMQQQQHLMDQTFDLNRQLENGAQQQGEQGNQGQQGKQDQKPMTEQELRQALKQLRKQQQNLQNQLGQLQKGLQGLGIKPGKGFGEAGKAMGKAGSALGEGKGEEALGQQGRALQALRQGAQDMMSQMQAMQGKGQGQGEGPGRGARQGDQYGENNRDPLGRPRSTTGPDFGDGVKVPDEIDIQRAREILNQIRKRLGNQLSPEMEKRYLERLLDMN